MYSPFLSAKGFGNRSLCFLKRFCFPPREESLASTTPREKREMAVLVSLRSPQVRSRKESLLLKFFDGMRNIFFNYKDLYRLKSVYIQ